jgi:glycosyltransferase involved in cell wall biosynthesis
MTHKILHLITDLNTGGAEVSLYRLLTRMDRTRFESQVVSLVPVGPVGERIRALGIPVRSLDLQPGRPTLAALVRLTGWLRRERPDLLQTWLYHADLLGLLAAKAAGLRRVVWNIRNSEMDLSKYRRLSGLVVQTCARLSGWPQAVISNSQAGRDFHARFGYHPRRWEVIPNGIDLDAYKPDPQARREVREELGLGAGALLVGQVARYDPMKGQGLFLRAAGKLVREGVDAHFALVGQDVTPENPALAEIVLREGLEGRVRLLGRREDTPRLYAALDILASPSIFGEGFPNVVAEAMACGVPCAVTDVGDSALVAGETGRVVLPGDPEALAAALQELVSAGAAKRGELGQAARRRVAERFSLEKTVAAYEELYEELLARPARGKAGNAR